MSKVTKLRYVEELNCPVEGLGYDFGQKRGMLIMAERASCDMTGCISLFCRIDGAVELIETYAAKVRDTSYQRIQGLWVAFDSKGKRLTPLGDEMQQPSRRRVR